MAERSVLLASVGIFLLLLFVFPWVGWRFQSQFRASSPDEAAQSLMRENEALRAELATLRDARATLGDARPDYFTASVYSRYPFNFKSELLIDRGEEDGVRPGATAVIPVREADASFVVFLGKVERVFARSALVRTLFDARTELAVRVGEKGVDALLEGGSDPRLTLITKSSVITPGDIVYTASDPHPYGLAVGTVGEVAPSADGLFQEAILLLSYDLNSVRSILISRGASPDVSP